MKDVLLILGAVLLALALAYGAWQFERWWNYKQYYYSQVAEQVQPLVDRVTALENRVLVLENKK